MYSDLFYDKYAGNHLPSNPLTVSITIPELSNGTFKLLLDEDAFDFLDTIFGPNNRYVPSREMCELDEFRLKVYTKDEIIITVISINTENLLTASDNIKEMVKKACIYHYSYILSTNRIINDHLYISASFEVKLKETIDFISNSASTAVDYTNDQRIEQPEWLTAPLFDFQKCNINWMINIERANYILEYNMNEIIPLENVFFDISKCNIFDNSAKNKLTFSGGALIDEVGMGKTLQMITLSLLNPTPPTQQPFKSPATVIICPNQLCGQWKRELTKMIKSTYPLNIISFLTKRDFDKYTYENLLTADFIIISYTFLDNPAFTQSWASRISSVKSFNKSEWSKNDKKLVVEVFDELKEELNENYEENIKASKPIFNLITYHRLIIDEFHEIYSIPKYKYIKNILPYFKSTYKWCVTATPFLNDTCIIDIMNFLTGFKDENYEKLLLLDNITDHLINNCFRKNTKKSINDIEKFQLPPIEEEVQWLQFSSTERIIYNAHLANINNNRFDVFLRKLCCNPQLAEIALSNCKNLKEIEALMVEQYKKDMENTNNKITKINMSIAKIKALITEIEQKKAAKLNIQDDDEIANLLKTDKTKALQLLNERLAKNEAKLTEFTKQYEGKKATFEFFNNVVERLKNNIASEPEVKKETKQITNIMDMYDIDSEEDTSDPSAPSSSAPSSSTDIVSNYNSNKESCAICLDIIPDVNTGVTKCGHIFCYECIKACVTRYHNCPYCKTSLTSNEYYKLSYERNLKNSPLTKEKIDLINEYGTKLANLILYLKNITHHIIIFSQWGDLLSKVGNVLNENKIKNVFCKGNCYQRDKAIRDFNANDSIKVIMLSSESAASGTNLTKASEIILLDPIYGDYKFRKDQERQAIGRAHRMGQQNKVKVVRFVIKDTIEEEIYNLNTTEDKKHIDSQDYTLFTERNVD